MVYFKSDYATLLAFLLLGCLYISIGLLISSLTENQIIAAVATVGVLVLLYLWDGILNFLPTTAGGNLVGMILVVLLLALLLYSLTSSYVAAAAVAVVGIVALGVCYFIAPTCSPVFCPMCWGLLPEHRAHQLRHRLCL